MPEIWKPVVNFDGLYEISTNGRLRSLDHFVINRYKIDRRRSKIRSARCSRYLTTTLFKDGKRFHFLLHRLVALAFIPNPLNLSQVNHKNGDKSDNRSENLEWVSPKENTKHALDNNLRHPAKGDAHYNRRLNSAIVREMRSLFAAGKSSGDVSKIYNVPVGTVLDIKCRRTWKHLS